MYRQGETPPGPPPFGPPPHGPPYNVRGPCPFPPTGPLPRGPFCVPPPDINFIHNRPRREDFNRPNCSSFSIDHSKVLALGSSQQIISPADPPQQHVPQWNSTPRKNLADSDQAGEEFLRCLAANKPLPDYLKGDMAYNLAEALKSASILKDTLKSDPVFKKLISRSRSRGRSRSRSRGRSRGHSRGRSRGKSRAKSRGRSKSRVRSRSQRSRSRTRGKSLAKDKTRIRSRSRSHSKKRHARSKSRVRRSKSRSRSSSTEKRHHNDTKTKMNLKDSKSNIGNNNQPRKSLVEGLKMVMNSKELEERLPNLKDAILTIKASKEGKSQNLIQENSSLENESMVLPHDRVGSDFFWLQTQTEEMSEHQKADEVEDEESFLYGKEVAEGQDSKSSITLFPAFSQIGGNSKLQDTTLANKQNAQTPFSNSGSQRLSSVNLGRSEYAKIKDILNSQSPAEVRNTISPVSGFSAGTVLNSAMPPMKTPNIHQALESLQSLIKATKENRERNEGSGIVQISDKQRAGHIDNKNREKREKIYRIECLMKELNELMSKDGLSFLTPVIGFYCQKCEEFIGDLGSAENHANVHQDKNPSSQKVPTDNKSEQKQDGDKKGPLHHFSSGHQHHQEPDRKKHRDYKPHKDLGNHKPHIDHQHDRGNHRNPKERHENFMKDEMFKERMLITVALGPTPSNVRMKEEEKKELTSSNQPSGSGRQPTQVEDKNKKKQSGERGSKDNSGDSDDDTKKTTKKKKKKEKDKKKKKKKGAKS